MEVGQHVWKTCNCMHLYSEEKELKRNQYLYVIKPNIGKVSKIHPLEKFAFSANDMFSWNSDLIVLQTAE